MANAISMFKTLQIAAAGMRVQSERLRVIGENIANSSSTAQSPGGEPYRRKTISFENVLNREFNVNTVRVAGYAFDKTDFAKHYDPTHPAAGKDGYVLLPNVNALIEMADMREAMRSYEANLSVVEATKSMLQKTIELLA